MTSWRDFDHEMERLPLDTQTADRLLAGAIPPPDAPPGYAKVASALAAVQDDFDPVPDCEEEVIAMLVAAVRSSRRETSAPPRRSAVHRLKLATAVSALALASATGLAFAGSLPGAAQDVASAMLAKVGVTVPGANENAGSHPDVRGKSAESLPAIGHVFTTRTPTTNTDAGNFRLHVQAPPPPNTAPQLTVPGPLTVEGNTTNGATVSFSVTATDAQDDPDPTPSCDHASGSFFALGTTTVTCSVTDSGGVSDGGFFSVTVVDTMPPAIIAPPNETVEGNTTGGATVNDAAAQANDVVDSSPAVGCSPTPGFYPLGTTPVTCTATDTSGNSSSATFTITVVDTTPPALSLPGDQTAEATGPSGAVVTYPASASDIVDGAVAVNCLPASGSTFVLGSTTVNCSATDSSGNTATGSFGVTVQDTTPPSLSLPSNITTTASGNNSAVVTYAASASDLVDGAVGVTCSLASGSSFPAGTTTVNCSATDSHNNTANGSFTVTVDTTEQASSSPSTTA